MMSGPRITSSPALGRRRSRSAAPSYKEVRRLERKARQGRERNIELNLIAAESSAAAEAAAEAVQADIYASGLEAEVWGDAMKIVPWALGGVAAVVVAAMLLRRPKKKAAKSPRRRKR